MNSKISKIFRHKIEVYLNIIPLKILPGIHKKIMKEHRKVFFQYILYEYICDLSQGKGPKAVKIDFLVFTSISI